MPEPSLVLYDALNSPAGRRVRIVLLEKGLDAEIRWLDLARMEQKSPAYLSVNPNGVVPALLHGERVLFESNVIAEYLDETFGGPRLVPADPWQRTRMRMWFAYEQEWAKPFRDAIYETHAKARLVGSGLTPQTLPAAIAASTPNPAYVRAALGLLESPRNEQVLADRIAVLMERMGWMEEQLGDGREWLLGEAFSLADIALAPRLAMFPFIGVDDLAARFPRIGAFLARVAARPSWEPSGRLPAPGVKVTRLGAAGA